MNEKSLKPEDKVKLSLKSGIAYVVIMTSSFGDEFTEDVVSVFSDKIKALKDVESHQRMADEGINKDIGRKVEYFHIRIYDLETGERRDI